MDPAAASKYLFGHFELDAGRRLLLKDGEPVQLNYRSLELLLALVSRSGETLTKDELLSSVWEGQFVEEGNLTVHISALRKALGETRGENKFIATVPGRGYSFVAPTSTTSGSGFITETHSLAQIVVDEEITDDEGPPAALLGPAPSRLSARPLMFAGGLAILLVVAGYFAYQRFRPASLRPSPGRITIKRLTTNGTVGSATLSPDGKLFAYALGEGEQTSLWLGHVDGGEPVRLRPPSDQVYLSLRFAPDGGTLYYTVSNNFSDGTLYRIPTFGGVPEKIHSNFRTMTFSPDGTRMGYVGFNAEKQKSVMMSANPQGNGEEEIAEFPPGIGGGWRSPAWSPDGKTIGVIAAVANDVAELYTIDIPSRTVTKMPVPAFRRIDSLAWDRDSRGLVIVAIEQNAAAPQMWYANFPGGELTRLTNDLGEYATVASVANDNSILTLQGISESNVWLAPANDLSAAKQVTFGSPGRKDGWDGIAWSTDSRVVYTATTAEGTSLWIMNSDGSKSRQLVPSGGTSTYPSISADGKNVVFQSTRSGRFAVWRCDLEGQQLVELTSEPVAGQPFISPDGQWVIYNSHIDSNGQLSKVSPAGGEPQKLCDNAGSWAQVSPDSTLVAGELATDQGAMLAVFSLDGCEVKKTFPLPRLGNVRLGIHWMPDGRAIAYRDWANGIWRQPIDGGEAKRLPGLPEEKLYAFAWSPDGRYLAYTRGSTTRDVVLITGAIQ